VSEIAAPVKIAKIRAYGADAHVEGATYFDALTLCGAYVAETGALAIHAYESPATIAGQGTVAMEWEEDLARVDLTPLDTVLVAVGGGGLIAGVATWFEGRVKVVGVEPEGSRALHAALEAGHPVDVTIKSIAADSLGARRVGDLAFAILGRAKAGVALVTDAAIRGPACAVAKPFDHHRTRRRGGLCAAGERRLCPGAQRKGRHSRLRRQRGSSDIRGLRRRRRCCGARPRPLWSARFASAGPGFRGLLGRSQAVRQRILIPPSPGSNPGAPATHCRAGRPWRISRKAP
jgi:hypothetical protein